MLDRILIIDAAATRPYTNLSLIDGALGELEAAIVRLAGGLSQTCEVIVAQTARRDPAIGTDGVAYVPNDLNESHPDVDLPVAVIVVGPPELLPAARRRYRNVRLCYLISPNARMGGRLRGLAKYARGAEALVVAPNEQKKKEVNEFLKVVDPFNTRLLNMAVLPVPHPGHGFGLESPWAPYRPTDVIGPWEALLLGPESILRPA